MWSSAEFTGTLSSRQGGGGGGGGRLRALRQGSCFLSFLQKKKLLSFFPLFLLHAFLPLSFLSYFFPNYFPFDRRRPTSEEIK